MDMKAVNAMVIERFRAGDEIEGMHRDRLLLLTTTGRATGDRHTTPMMRIPLEGDQLVVASNDGATSPPDWFLNLEADRHVSVEMPDGSSWDCAAVVEDGADRDRGWAAVVTAAPFFAEHEQRAGRPLPVVRLHPEA